MNPDLWLSNKFRGEFFSGRFDHLKTVVSKLGLNNQKSKVVTIAGTNGKGQTARVLSEYLLKNNYSYALWTSPHLEKVNERFVINGKDATDARLINCFEEVSLELENLGSCLSYFEFLFICFLWLNKSQNVDYLILEVGLGGRLDACNSIDCDIAVITSISRDHQSILGKYYFQILHEKLGVSRSKKPLITALELDYLRQKTRIYVKNRDIPHIDLFEQNKLSRTDDFSYRNNLLAQEIFSAITGSLPRNKISFKFSAMRSHFSKNNAIFSLFPSHNVDGLRKLSQFIDSNSDLEFTHILMSFSDREYSELRTMIKSILLLYKPENIQLFYFNHIKAVKKDKLERLSKEFGIKLSDDKNKVFNNYTQFKCKVVVTGSNYFLGHFSSFFKQTGF